MKPAVPPPLPPAVSSYPVVRWLDESEHSLRDEAAYWNDYASESKKEWADETDGFARTRDVLERTGIRAHLEWAISEARASAKGGSRTGVDLACGTCWAAPFLLSGGFVSHLTCVDFSRPRIFRTAPRFLSAHGVDPERITLAWGAIDHSPLPDASMDLVHLAQAVHCVGDPDALFSEIRRMLSSKGVVLVVADPYPGSRASFRLALRMLARGLGTGTPPRRWETFVPRDASGARVYPPFFYRTLARVHGFRVKSWLDAARRRQSHVLSPT